MSTTPAPVYWFDAWVERISVQLAENIQIQQPQDAKMVSINLLFSEGSVWPDLYEIKWDGGQKVTEPHEYRPNPVQFPERFFIRRSHHQYEQDLSIPHRHHQADPVADLFLKNACLWDNDFYADCWSIWIPGCLPRLLLDLSVVQVEQVLPTALANEGIHCKKNWQFVVKDSQGKPMKLLLPQLIEQVQEQLNFYFQEDKVFALASALCFEREENKAWFDQLRQKASKRF